MLNSQLKSFQERMKRVEESLLSTDYKKHIQVRGGCQGGDLPLGCWSKARGASVMDPESRGGWRQGGTGQPKWGAKPCSWEVRGLLVSLEHK